MFQQMRRTSMPDRFVARVAEEPLRCCVPVGHAQVQIPFDDSQRRLLRPQREPALRAPQIGFHALTARDVGVQHPIKKDRAPEQDEQHGELDDARSASRSDARVQGFVHRDLRMVDRLQRAGDASAFALPSVIDKPPAKPQTHRHQQPDQRPHPHLPPTHNPIQQAKRADRETRKDHIVEVGR